MHVKVGDAIDSPMPDGRIYPALVISDEVIVPTTIVSKQTGQPVEIEVTRAEVLSLREARDGTVYTAVTNEVIQYGYRSVAMPRFNKVIGLDVDADGTLRTLEQNMADHRKSYTEWAAGNFEARRGVVAATDL